MSADAERLRADLAALNIEVGRVLPDDDGEPATIVGIVDQGFTDAAWTSDLDPDESRPDAFRVPRWYRVGVIRIHAADVPTLAEISQSGFILAANIGHAKVPGHDYGPDSTEHATVTCTRLTRYWAFRWDGV